MVVRQIKEHQNAIQKVAGLEDCYCQEDIHRVKPQPASKHTQPNPQRHTEQEPIDDDITGNYFIWNNNSTNSLTSSVTSDNDQRGSQPAVNHTWPGLQKNVEQLKDDDVIGKLCTYDKEPPESLMSPVTDDNDQSESSDAGNAGSSPADEEQCK